MQSFGANTLSVRTIWAIGLFRILGIELELACNRGSCGAIFSLANTFNDISPPHEPPLQASSSSIPRIRIWCIVISLFSWKLYRQPRSQRFSIPKRRGAKVVLLPLDSLSFRFVYFFWTFHLQLEKFKNRNSLVQLTYQHTGQRIVQPPGKSIDAS